MENHRSFGIKEDHGIAVPPTNPFFVKENGFA